jgi:hypothetical protein
MQMFSPSNLRRARRSTGGKSPRGSRTSAAAAAAAAPHAPEDEADYFDLTEQVFFGESGGVIAVAVRPPELTDALLRSQRDLLPPSPVPLLTDSPRPLPSVTVPR